jgi:uncharacterized integral membrane protein
MRKFLNAIVWIPLAVILVVFAVANRHLITVSFDPFNSNDPALGITLPLFVVIIAVAILGVVAGGSATWFGQRRWRRANALSQQRDSAPPPTVPQVGYRRDKHGATL